VIRRTRIVCTIGPSSASPAVLKNLLKAGMDVARLNFSHGDHATHRQAAADVRAAAEEADRPVALLGDLQGPKIRTGALESGFQRLVRGRRVFLIGGPRESENEIEVSHAELVEALRVNDRVLIDDGRIELVVRGRSKGRAECSVVRGGLLGERKGVSVPGRPLPMPALTEKDLSDLDLSYVDFKRANLKGTSLFGTKLIKANLAGADLSRANLNGAWLMGTNLAGADLSGSSLLSPVVVGGPVNEAPRFAGANLAGARMMGDWMQADFRGANFSNAHMGVDIRNQGMGQMRNDFSGADLSGANFSGADVNRALMSFAKLAGAKAMSFTAIVSVSRAQSRAATSAHSAPAPWPAHHCQSIARRWHAHSVSHARLQTRSMPSPIGTLPPSISSRRRCC
jgi:uncharacterized protein YjbI with pentapeptide repeats